MGLLQEASETSVATVRGLRRQVEMQFIRCDIKSGGGTFYCMTGSGGMKMYGRAHYLEIEKPHRIVYTQEFCDENENISRHPMAPTWPATMLSTVNLSAEGPEQTRVTITWECYGHTTPEELATSFLNLVLTTVRLSSILR